MGVWVQNQKKNFITLCLVETPPIFFFALDGPNSFPAFFSDRIKNPEGKGAVLQLLNEFGKPNTNAGTFT